jgi:hypothetical protein
VRSALAQHANASALSSATPTALRGRNFPSSANGTDYLNATAKSNSVLGGPASHPLVRESTSRPRSSRTRKQSTRPRAIAHTAEHRP